MDSTETGSSGLIFPWGRMKGNEQEEVELGSGSPHLWRPGSTSYPRALPTTYPMSARAEEIAKGRQELMKMFEGMPESSYELSLSDLVEQKDTMQKKSNQEANVEETEESEERSIEKEAKRKTRGSYRSGSTKKIGDDKQFLLNIFLPTSLTSRSHRSIPSNCSSKNGDLEKGSGNKYNFTYFANLLKSKTPYSSIDSSISFSKVSPKPFSAKDGNAYQPVPTASMESCYISRLSKLARLSRCSLCYGHTFFSKVNCQACKRSFCKSCVKVSIENTAEGQKCCNNCKGQFHADRCSEEQFNRCFPFLPLNSKSERKSRFPLMDQENDCQSI